MAEEVQFKLTVDDEASAGLKQAESGFKNLQATAKEAAVTFAAIGATGGLMIKGFIDAASSAEQTRVAMEVMLGSTEKANKMLKDLTDFASHTPFNLTGVQENAKMLMNFGIEADKIIPDLKMLGDVSMGDAEHMHSLTLAFAQISSAGKLSGQDLLQLINAGFNPLQEISKKTGKSMAQLKDDMSQGLISFAMVEDAFKGVTSEGGRFYEMMDKESQTFGGQVSNIEDNIGQLAVQMGNALLPTAKEVAAWVGKITDYFKSLSPETQALIGKTIAVAAGFATVAAAIAGVIAVINPVSVAVVAITVGVAALYAAWNTNFLGIRDISEAVFGWITTKLQELWNYIGPTLSQIGEDLKKTFDFWVKLIQDNWDTISTVFSTAWTFIQAEWEIFWDTFKAIFEVAWSIFSGLMKTYLAVMRGDWSGAWNAIQEIFTNVWKIIKQWISDTWEWAKKYLGETWEKITKDIKDKIITPVTTAWDNFWKGLSNTVKNIVDEIGRWIDALIERLKNLGQQILGVASSAAKAGISVLSAIPGMGAISSMANSLSPKAEGGAVSSSSPYLVGERGPELFIPNQSGTIVPNRNLSGGGGSTIIINMNGPISSKEVAQEMADQMIDVFKMHSMAI